MCLHYHPKSKEPVDSKTELYQAYCSTFTDLQVGYLTCCISNNILYTTEYLFWQKACQPLARLFKDRWYAIARSDILLVGAFFGVSVDPDEVAGAPELVPVKDEVECPPPLAPPPPTTWPSCGKRSAKIKVREPAKLTCTLLPDWCAMDA